MFLLKKRNIFFCTNLIYLNGEIEKINKTINLIDSINNVGDNENIIYVPRKIKLYQVRISH